MYFSVFIPRYREINLALNSGVSSLLRFVVRIQVIAIGHTTTTARITKLNNVVIALESESKLKRKAKKIKAL